MVSPSLRVRENGSAALPCIEQTLKLPRVLTSPPTLFGIFNNLLNSLSNVDLTCQQYTLYYSCSINGGELCWRATRQGIMESRKYIMYRTFRCCKTNSPSIGRHFFKVLSCSCLKKRTSTSPVAVGARI